MSKQRDHREMEQRRLKAVKYFEQGLGPSEVARRLGVKRQSAHAWKVAWEKGGKVSLRSRGPAGRKARLTPVQQQELVDALLEGPQACGYATQVWTLPRVRALIRKRTGETYHPGHVSRLLHALGFSCQRPERRAIERDERAIARWKRVTWPAIKKKHAASGGSSSTSTKAG
jgi:transposase